MKKPMYILAPMDDVTDTVFRRIVADCAAPDYTMTEFVNVDGLNSPGRPRLIRKLDTALDTAPVIAQIWGKKPENFEVIAKEISDGEMPGFVGIDLNFGCPAKSEVKAGCCSALQQLDLRPDAAAMIEATLRGAAAGKNNLPVSFKTRLGFGEVDYTWHEFLLGYKPWMLTVHVRTTRQMSKVPAQWHMIERIVRLRDELSPETKIVLNGDIMNRAHGDALMERYGVDGLMIGRGVFQDPYCFAQDDHDTDCAYVGHTESDGTLHAQKDEVLVTCQCDTEWSLVGKQERIDLLKKQMTLHDELYADGQRPFNPLKKFAKIYINGFAGASKLRAAIMETTSVDEALELLSKEK